MTTIPNTPKELQVLNTRPYRALHYLFERLSGTNPDLNVAILDLMNSLDKTNQLKLMNVLYQLESERLKFKSIRK